MPRPINAQYLAETAKTIKEAREKETRATCRSSSSTSSRRSRPSGMTSRATIATTRPKTRRSTNATPPGSATTRSGYRSRCILKSKPEELIEAGYPESQVRAFLDAYHELEQAESSSPGHVSSRPRPRKFLAASRALGEAVNPTKYPTVAMIERETHFNAMNPFWQAPYRVWHRRGAPGSSAWGSSRSTGQGIVRRLSGVDDLPPRPRRAWLIGIALEIYGFYLRVRISGWAPVTNMYETVIWVALVAAVLSFVFEMIYRKSLHGAGRVGGRAPGHDHRGQCPAPGPEHQEPPAGPARATSG